MKAASKPWRREGFRVWGLGMLISMEMVLSPRMDILLTAQLMGIINHFLRLYKNPAPEDYVLPRREVQHDKNNNADKTIRFKSRKHDNSRVPSMGP